MIREAAPAAKSSISVDTVRSLLLSSSRYEDVDKVSNSLSILSEIAPLFEKIGPIVANNLSASLLSGMYQTLIYARSRDQDANILSDLRSNYNKVVRKLSERNKLSNKDNVTIQSGIKDIYSNLNVFMASNGFPQSSQYNTDYLDEIIDKYTKLSEGIGPDETGFSDREEQVLNDDINYFLDRVPALTAIHANEYSQNLRVNMDLSDVKEDARKIVSSLLSNASTFSKETLGSFSTRNDISKRKKNIDEIASAMGFMLASMFVVNRSIKEDDVTSQKINDRAKKAISSWNTFKKKVNGTFGASFWDSFNEEIKERYPNAASFMQSSVDSPKMSSKVGKNEKKIIVKNFFNEVKALFLTKYNPPGNNVIENMFSNFPDENSPFDRVLDWFEGQYNTIYSKPNKTSGDIEFLRAYYNKGKEYGYVFGNASAAGIVRRVTERWFEDKFKQIPENKRKPGQPSIVRINDEEASKLTVESLMRLVKSRAASDKEPVGRDEIMGKMTSFVNGEIREANNVNYPVPEIPPLESLQLPPSFPAPPPVVEESFKTPIPTAPPPGQQIPGGKPPSPQGDVQQSDQYEKVPAGAAYRALAVASMLFSDLKVETESEKEMIQLNRSPKDMINLSRD